MAAGDGPESAAACFRLRSEPDHTVIGISSSGGERTRTADFYVAKEDRSVSGTRRWMTVDKNAQLRGLWVFGGCRRMSGDARWTRDGRVRGCAARPLVGTGVLSPTKTNWTAVSAAYSARRILHRTYGSTDPCTRFAPFRPGQIPSEPHPAAWAVVPCSSPAAPTAASDTK